VLAVSLVEFKGVGTDQVKGSHEDLSGEGNDEDCVTI